MNKAFPEKTFFVSTRYLYLSPTEKNHLQHPILCNGSLNTMYNGEYYDKFK